MKTIFNEIPHDTTTFIHCEVWEPEGSIIGAIILIHGLGEHIVDIAHILPTILQAKVTQLSLLIFQDMGNRVEKEDISVNVMFLAI